MKKIAVAVIISVITLADLCGQEKAIEYEGHVSAYISYPSPGFGDWQNPGCGLMTTHGVGFKLKNSHRVDLSIDVRTVFGDFASVGSPASVYPHLAVGYRF